MVNERLNKEIFDCNEISDKYNCGCGPDDKKDGDDDETSVVSKVKSKEGRSTEEKKIDRAALLGEPEIDHSPNDMVRGG